MAILPFDDIYTTLVEECGARESERYSFLSQAQNAEFKMIFQKEWGLQYPFKNQDGDEFLLVLTNEEGGKRWRVQDYPFMETTVKEEIILLANKRLAQRLRLFELESVERR
jgi:hypothetical protein